MAASLWRPGDAVRGCPYEADEDARHRAEPAELTTAEYMRLAKDPRCIASDDHFPFSDFLSVRDMQRLHFLFWRMNRGAHDEMATGEPADAGAGGERGDHADGEVAVAERAG